ncbi:MAG: ABC transporter ATP-binding protein [Christensenellales bacterium]
MSEKQRPKRRGPMHGGPAAMRPAEKAKDFKGTFKKLMAYLRAYWLPLVLMIVFAVASTVFTIVGPKILGSATNKLVEGISGQMMYDKIQSQLPEGVVLPEGTKGEAVLSAMPDEAKEQLSQSQLETLSEMDISKRPEIDFSGIGHILLWLMGLYALSALFQYIQGYITTGISQKVAYRLRRDISQKINRMPLKYFDRTSHGDVLSRITNDVDTVSQSLNQSISQLVSAATTLVGILIMMISISLPMTLVALLVLPLSLLVVKSVVKRSQKNFVDQQNALGALNGHVEEMYGGHLVMKAFNGEQASLSQFKKVNDELYENARKAQFLSGLMMPILNFISNLGYVGVCVLGGYLANGKLVEIGDIQAFIQYVRNFNQPITQTANMANLLQSTMAAAERVFVFLEEEEEVPESKAPKTIEHVRGAVEFDHVAFGYRADKQVIKDFNASIRPEQKVAIVGPTGAGKTTMVNLLMRFYDVDSGAIRVDGVDIRQMRREELRALFGMVLQDTWLFSGTIRENIVYGKLDATEEEIQSAAKAAHVDHFVRTLSEGYDTVLNEDASNISQGQRQLLTIARALLADPPILILDEATSSVDTRTEVLIQQAMDNLMKGRTSFIIAHRLSTIRDADLILVMKEGNIIEQGTHAQLLAQNGFYAELYNSQFADGEE